MNTTVYKISERSPVFPCWLFHRRLRKWTHHSEEPLFGADDGHSHWHPDQPTAPTSAPDGVKERGMGTVSMEPPVVMHLSAAPQEGTPTPRTDAAEKWMKEVGRWKQEFPAIVAKEDMAALESDLAARDAELAQTGKLLYEAKQVETPFWRAKAERAEAIAEQCRTECEIAERHQAKAEAELAQVRETLRISSEGNRNLAESNLRMARNEHRLAREIEEWRAKAEALLTHLPDNWGDAVVEGEVMLRVDSDAIDAAIGRKAMTLSERLRAREGDNNDDLIDQAADALDVLTARNKELEGALRDVIAAYDAVPDDCMAASDSVVWNWETYIARAREVLK